MASLSPSTEQNATALPGFDTSLNAAEMLAGRTAHVDAIVTRAAAEFLTGVVPVAVAAAGGYGRRELFPQSDVDLLIAVEQEAELELLKEPLSHFLRALWDAGLRVSHSSRTVAECCRLNDQNIELHISLLDLRFLHGDEEVAQLLRAKLPDLYSRHAGVLVRRLVEMVRHRHAKFNNTVYHLEPNIKEAPGGIRDIHLLRWIAQLLPGNESIQECTAGLDDAIQFLYTLRCFLHRQANRDNNLLSFELQDEAAQRLAAKPLTPEAWMRQYFQHARRVFQAATRGMEQAESAQPAPLLRQFRERRGRMSTSDFTIARERVFLRNAAETLASAESMIRLFTFSGRHGIKLSWDTQRRLQNERNRVAGAFNSQPAAWGLWRDLLSQPHAALALREMQETGLLSVVIPGWASVDSLVVRDFYHRYTVDEHTLVAVETIDQLVTKQANTPERFRQLASEEEELATLRLAILMHDLGKGTHSGDHIRGSLIAADRVCERMQVPEPQRESVRWLIDHHLDLSLVMNGRDLEDPATARFLTSRIGTQEDLRRLTLLTYADISAVNATSMSPWRLEQLWRVYALGAEQLTRELATDRIHETGGDAPPKLARFLDGLPKRYLRTHTRSDMERHAALADKSAREGVAVEIKRETGAWLLTVLAHDHPGLFAAVCGALASFGMNIVKAEAASNSAGCILDFIRFTDPIRTLDLNPPEVNRLQWTIECAVKGSIDVRDLLKRRRRIPRPTRDATIAPTVRFDDVASDTSTLVEFTGEDRPGLLYQLASAISGCDCNIEVVMIDTEAHKAVDVFYVTRDGAKLDAATRAQLESELIAAAEHPS